MGFRGYSGAELLRLLSRHSGVELFLLEHRADAELETVAPLGQKPPKTIPATPEAIKLEKLDLVFLATPAEVSMELARDILATGAKVIDLSGAFDYKIQRRTRAGTSNGTPLPTCWRKPPMACPNSIGTRFAGRAW